MYCGINFAETYKFEKDTENYVSNPSPEKFRKLILDNAPEYYNQLYDFIIDYSDNPNNINYIPDLPISNKFKINV